MLTNNHIRFFFCTSHSFVLIRTNDISKVNGIINGTFLMDTHF